MTPEEEAQELIFEFLPEIRGADRYSYNIDDINVFVAKQCAIITVNRISKVIGSEMFSEYGHYLKVKTEIQNYENCTNQ